jgi:hypothetical protein
MGGDIMSIRKMIYDFKLKRLEKKADLKYNY